MGGEAPDGFGGLGGQGETGEQVGEVGLGVDPGAVAVADWGVQKSLKTVILAPLYLG